MNQARRIAHPRLHSTVSNPPQQTPIHHQLKEAIAECDRLSRALSQEQADHEQTRVKRL